MALNVFVHGGDSACFTKKAMVSKFIVSQALPHQIYIVN